MGTRPPKFVFDADFLADVNLKIGDKLTPLCLSPSSFAILTQMNEMLLWPTRWSGSQNNIDAIKYLAWKELNIPELCPPDIEEPPEEETPEQETPLFTWLFEDNARLRACIAKLEMIIMWNMCGCGCGNNQNPEGELFTDAQLGQLTALMESIICEDVGTVDQSKCDSLNYIFDEWLDVVAELADYAANGQLTRAKVLDIIKSTNWLRPIQSLAYQLITAVFASLATSALASLRTWLSANRQALISIMYIATSPAEAQSLVTNYITGSRLSGGAKAIAWAITQLMDWNAIFAGDISVPVGYVAPTVCGPETEVEVPNDYYLKPMAVLSVAGDYNDAVSSFDSNVALLNLDQKQSGAYLDGTAYADTEGINTWNTGVGWLIVVENFQHNQQSSELIINSSNNSMLDTGVNLNGAPSTFQIRGRDASESGLTAWVNEVPAGFQQHANDWNDNRFTLRNVVQQNDCQASCKATFYVVDISP